MTKRMLWAVVVAVLLAGSGSAYVARLGIKDALCAIWPKDSAEWITFGCFMPKAPTTSHRTQEL